MAVCKVTSADVTTNMLADTSCSVVRTLATVRPSERSEPWLLFAASEPRAAYDRSRKVLSFEPDIREGSYYW